MDVDEVFKAKVVFEESDSPYRKLDEFEVDGGVFLDDGESVCRVPVLSGSLAQVENIESKLTRTSEKSSSGSFEFKIFGIGAKRSAKVTIERSTELTIKSGETKTRYIEVPVAWQRFSYPGQPDRTWVVVTPGVPPDGRYDVRVDGSRLPVTGAATNKIDYDADGLLAETDTVGVAGGFEFSLALELAKVKVSGALTVVVEQSTTTTVAYSVPKGRYELTWLEGSTGLYIATAPV